MARDELAKRRHFREDVRALKQKITARTRTGETDMPRKGQRSMGEDTTNTAVRLPKSTVAQIDAHVERMRREHPDLPITRVHALNNLIRRACAAIVDDMTDTTVPDAPQFRLMLQQELRAFFASAEGVIDAIHTAESVTDTVSDTQSQPDDQAVSEEPQHQIVVETKPIKARRGGSRKGGAK